MENALYNAIYAILKPLLRVCYRKGMAFGEFTQVLKRSYLDVAEEELLRNGDKITTSRLAVATGLTRKDVAQLRKEVPLTHEPSQRYNRSTRVLTGWATDEQFTDNAGAPLPLPRQGEGASFDALVERYSGDMVAKAVLEELIRIGAASLDETGCVHLLSDTYFATDASEEEGLSILGTDTALLISTINHNISVADTTDRRFQRKVSYDNLPEEVIPEFKALAAKESYELLVRLNTWLAAHDRDATQDLQGSGQVHAGVGIYYFEEDATQASEKDKD